MGNARRCGTVIIFICFAILALFQVKYLKAQEEETAIQGQNMTLSQGLPDLMVYSATFNPEPKEGDIVGKIIISIKNEGTGDSGENKLKLSCLIDKCEDESYSKLFSEAINATITVPPIKKDETMNIEWSPVSPIKWAKGRFTIAAEVDYENVIKEQNEVNNIKKTAISITSVSPATKAN